MIICPLDNNPCDPECPDRFHDVPDGGCLVTMMQEMGGPVLVLDEGGLKLCEPS